MSDLKEFHVDSRNYFPQTLQQVKEFLRDNKKGKIVANTPSANQATGVAETLRRLGFIEFDDIKTETKVVDNTRQVQLIITFHVTEDFDKLYEESEEERKKREEERKKREEERKKRFEERQKEREKNKPQTKK